MNQNRFFFGELSPWEYPSSPQQQQSRAKAKNRNRKQQPIKKSRSCSTKGHQPRKKPEQKHYFQPLIVNVVSLPRLVSHQREEFIKLLEQTAIQMRSTKISNSNLLESHLRHKRKLSKCSGKLNKTLKKLQIITANCNNTSPPPPTLRVETDQTLTFEVRRRLAEKFNQHRRPQRQKSRLSHDLS